MTRCRLAPGLLVGLMGLVAAPAIGQTAGGDVMKTLYVSPAGDDANPGTQERPLATIGGARDAVRGVNRNMTGDIVVILAGGTYSIAEPIVFDHRDSGTGGHKIVYRSRRRAGAGHQRRPGHYRLAARRRRTLEGVYQPEQLPPVVRGRKTGRAGTGRCAAGRGTARQRRLHNRRQSRWPIGKTSRTSSSATTWSGATRGARSGASSGKATARSSPCSSPTSRNAREKEGVQVNLPSYIENALELLDEPGEWYLDRARKDGVLQAASGPGHDQGPRRRSGRRETGRAAGDSGSTRRERPLRRHHLRRGRLAPAQRDRPGRRAGQLPVELEGSDAARARHHGRPQRAAQEPGQRGLPRGQGGPLRAVHVHAAGRGGHRHRVRFAGQRDFRLPLSRHLGHGRPGGRCAEGRPSSGRSAQDRQEQRRGEQLHSRLLRGVHGRRGGVCGLHRRHGHRAQRDLRGCPIPGFPSAGVGARKTPAAATKATTCPSSTTRPRPRATTASSSTTSTT